MSLHDDDEKDICENNHGGNPESRAAYDASKGNMDEQRWAIYNWFVDQGPRGGTREQALIALGMADTDGKAFHGGYPRCSDLLRSGKLVRTNRRGKTVNGNSCGILIAVDYTPRGDAQLR